MIEDGIQIPGAPVPAARARVFRNGRTTFDPKAKEKTVARRIVAGQWNKEPLNNEALIVELSFGMKIPESFSKKKRAKLAGCPHTSRPDTDNLIKFSLDVLNNIVYSDDSCIYDIRATKHYSETPQTLIKITRK